MSIPKVIHYCWFGGNPLPSPVKKCIRSWKTFCPDYEIIQWNESNFDVQALPFTKEAGEAKKWAFISDYARLKIIYEHGGIYLDTDVELLKPLDSMLEFEGFLGFQDDALVATGLGFGAVPRHPVIKALMAPYESQHFLLPDGSWNMLPCPDRDTAVLTELGLTANGTRQSLLGIQVLPPDYLAPMSWRTGKLVLTENTLSVHHYLALWQSRRELCWLRVRRLIGTPNYEKLRFGILRPMTTAIRSALHWPGRSS